MSERPTEPTQLLTVSRAAPGHRVMPPSYRAVMLGSGRANFTCPHQTEALCRLRAHGEARDGRARRHSFHRSRRRGIAAAGLDRRVSRCGRQRPCGVRCRPQLHPGEPRTHRARTTSSRPTLDRKAVLDLLSPRPGMSARLLEMAECGLLERLFPELQHIHRRAAPDPYRRHSAGVHAVLPVAAPRAAAHAGRPGPGALHRPARGAACARVASPSRCCCTMSARDAITAMRARACASRSRRSIGSSCQPAAAEPLRFLIRHHRQMARVAFRRDAGNPDVVARFATLVGSEELLKMLCLVTLDRHRGDQPGCAHAVEGRSAVAPLYRYAASGSRSARPAPPGSTTPGWPWRWPGVRRHLGHGAGALRDRPAAAPTCRCSACRPSTATCVSRAASCRTRCMPRSSSTATSAG